MKMRLGLIYQHQQKISGARKIWQAAHGNPITYSPEPGWKKVEHNLAEEQVRSLAQGHQSEANTFLQQYQLDERQSYLEAAESSAKRAFLLQRDILSPTDPEFLSTVGLLVLIYSKNDERRIYEKTYRHLYLSSDGIKNTLVLPNSRISAATSTGSPSIVTSISSSISEAVKKHNDDEVDRLLSIIGTGSSKEVTAAFMHAIDCGCEKCDEYIENLLDRDFDCTVPFTYAVKKSRLEHCKLFLVQGADINHVDAALLTPLMHAVKREDVRTVAFLMGNKADINIQGESARTALHFAIRAGDRAVFEKLLTAGWDQLNADIQDKDGLTALHECAKQNNVEFARRILRIDANPEVRDGSNKRRSPLWIAVKEDKYDFVKMLLECGAEVDLDYLPSGSRDIRKLLKQHSGQVQLTATGSARRRRFLNFGRHGCSTSLA